ncbi:MAG: response regulator [Bacteroidota bacterium]|nr:response regulator [Bacteroidota bacterium]
MVLLILESSKLITDRLIDLISEAREGVKFFRADSYKQATELLDEFNPDVVVLDLNLPGATTLELIKKIKESNDKRTVIVLFSITDEYTLKQCREYGADFLFDNYYEFEKIPAVISSIRTKQQHPNG